jgi:HK97 family phage major capsid protein
MSTLLQQAATAAKAAREIAEKAHREKRDDDRPKSASEFDGQVQRGHRQEGPARPGRVPGLEGPRQLEEHRRDHGRGRRRPGVLQRRTTAASKTWARTAAARLEKSMHDVDGQKAVVSGTYGVPNVIDPNIVSIGQVPTYAARPHPHARPATSDGSGGNAFTFLRQTVRTNNAAVVADSATKPTSVYTIAEIEDRFRVIAHLSEAIPLRYFADHNQLESWLAVRDGLRAAPARSQAEVLAGDGTGEHFTGILNTSGHRRPGVRHRRAHHDTQGEDRPR